MDKQRLLELAGVQLNEDSTKNSLGFHYDNFLRLIKELETFEKTLIAQKHVASAKSISNIIGSMQQNKRSFSSAKADLGK